MSKYTQYKLTIHFKHTLVDKVKNLFRPKSNRFPAVAEFEVYSYEYTGGSLEVQFEHGADAYYYPLHTIKRVKAEYLYKSK